MWKSLNKIIEKIKPVNIKLIGREDSAEWINPNITERSCGDNGRYKYIVDVLKDHGIVKGLVVDCAAGNGFGSSYLLNNGFNVNAFELNEYAVQNCLNLGIEAKIGSICDLPCQNDYADIFVSSETLEHLTSAETISAVAEINRITKSDGYICITVPQDKDVCLSNPFHKQFLTYDDLIKLFIFGTPVFKGSYCKAPGRCNLVVLFKKRNINNLYVR